MTNQQSTATILRGIEQTEFNSVFTFDLEIYNGTSSSHSQFANEDWRMNRVKMMTNLKDLGEK